ncbi:MAG: DUF4468 domain-containing protein [Bacteroidia bacterium]
MKYKIFLKFLTVFFLYAFAANAQVQDPLSPGYDENYDESAFDSTEMESKLNDKDEPVNPLLKPYERIKLPFDSITNLITYSGVVDQDESGSDSLYIRAKKWAEKTFLKGYKVETDKRNQKLVYIATIPAYSYNNPYSRRPIGTFEFKFTVLIKEGRYKYQISNLVHESLKPASGKSTRNYFEYYYTTNVSVQNSDRILRYADKDINNMIASFKKAMAEPILVDEDDW